MLDKLLHPLTLSELSYVAERVLQELGLNISLTPKEIRVAAHNTSAKERSTGRSFAARAESGFLISAVPSSGHGISLTRYPCSPKTVLDSCWYP
jgi:hypothetical protein